MTNLILIDENKQFPQSFNELSRRLKKLDIDIQKCEINQEDWSVSVSGDVNISFEELKNKKLEIVPFKYLPIKFNKVNGDFNCSDHELISLRGCPRIINGQFICSYNKLTSLKYAPAIGSTYFNCSHNQITSLKFKHQQVSGRFFCYHNKLTEIDMIPYGISEFDCSNNQITGFSKQIIKTYNKYNSSFKFTKLNLAFNQLTSLKNIVNSAHIQVIDCSFNKITSLKQTPKLPNLLDLILDNNQISFFENTFSDKIRFISLENNPLIGFNSKNLEKLCYLCLKHTLLKNYQELNQLPEMCEIKLDYTSIDIDTKINICKHSIGSICWIIEDCSFNEMNIETKRLRQKEIVEYLKKQKTLLEIL